MARMFGDVGALQEMLESSIEIIGDILTLFGIVVILMILDFQLAVVTLAIVPLLFLIRVIWQPFARRAFLRMRRNSSVVGVYLDQNVSGIRVVQALNRQQENHGIMGGKVHTFFWSTVRAARLGGALMPTVELMTGTALLLVLIVGGGRVLSGYIEVGTMVAFLLYVQRFFEPIRTLTMHYALLQRAVASGHRIFELLDIPLAIADKPDARPIGDVRGRIEFKDVTFGYDPERPILRNISFVAEPGQTIALVGPTGSGKTSITALAHRFYDVQEGSITIDADLLDASGILPYEMVHLLDITNGARLETYAIAGKRGSGEVCVNGAAGLLVRDRDLVIIMHYVQVADEQEACNIKPKVVRVDRKNRIVSTSDKIEPNSYY